MTQLNLNTSRARLEAREIMAKVNAEVFSPTLGLLHLVHAASWGDAFEAFSYMEALRALFIRVNDEGWGEEVSIEHRVLPVTWRSAEEFYLYANHAMGHTFETADFLRGYMGCEDPGERLKASTAAEERLLQQHRAQAEERARATEQAIQAVQEHGTQAKAAEALGFKGHSRVSQIVSGTANRIGTNGTQLKLSAGTDPARAAARIRERLGDTFADDLKRLL